MHYRFTVSTGGNKPLLMKFANYTHSKKNTLDTTITFFVVYAADSLELGLPNVSLTLVKAPSGKLLVYIPFRVLIKRSLIRETTPHSLGRLDQGKFILMESHRCYSAIGPPFNNLNRRTPNLHEEVH